MRLLFTTFGLILTMILGISNSSFAQVGVIPDVSVMEAEEQSKEKTAYELELLKLKGEVQAVIPHAVSITMLGSGFGTCSGVLIKNTEEESIVLTAKHCIGQVEELYVEGILATDVGVSFYDDMAYIKLGQMIPDKTPAKLSEFEPVKGDRAIVIGYPAFELVIKIGKMHIKTLDWQFALINIIPGCSGGGVFNEYGELVGIVWGSIGGTEALNKKDSKIGVFERYEDVVAFVKKNKLLE